MKAAGGYEVLSNRESGEGRTDLILKERKFRGRSAILELKVAGTFDEEMESPVPEGA